MNVLYRLSVIFLFFLSMTGKAYATISPEEIKHKLVMHHFQGTSLIHSILGIVQDNKGVIWACSPEGLFKFNGHYFAEDQILKKIMAENDEMSILALEEKDGLLLVGTSHGFYMYNPLTKRVKTYNTDSCQADTCLLNKRIECFAKDGQGLWLGTWYGVSYLDFATGKFRHFPIPWSRDKNHPTAVRSLAVVGNYLWYGTWSGDVYRLHKQTHQIRQYFSGKPESPAKGITTRIRQVAGKLIICSFDNAIQVYDPAHDSFHPLAQDLPGLQLSSQRVHDILAPKGGLLWIGTENGISLYNERAKNTIQINAIQGDARLGSQAGTFVVSNLLADKLGNVWVGTAKGLFHYHPLHRQVRSFPFAQQDFFQGNILSVLPLSGNRILINGVNQSLLYDHKHHTYTPFMLRDANHEMVQVFSLDTATGRIYLGGRESLFLLERNSPVAARIFRMKDQNKVAMAVSSILPVTSANLLITLNEIGLTAVNLQSGQAEVLDARTQTFIKRDRKGRLWHNPTRILSRFDKTSGKSRPMYFLINGKRRTLNVKSLYEDTKGQLWAETKKTVLRLDPDAMRGRVLLNQEDLHNEQPLGMAVENENTLWVLTHEKLYRYHITQDKIRFFDKNDGLLADNLSGSKLLYLNHQLFIIGPRGINVLDTKELQTNDRLPSTLISSFRLGPGQYLPFTAGKPVSLKSGQNNLTLTFLSDNYLYPQKNKFVYRMDGLDTNWREARGFNEAQYNNLPPGHYQFRVKTANNDGLWGNETRMNIIIALPWWQTVYAQVALAALLPLLIYAVSKIRTARIEAQKKLLERKIEKRTHDLFVANQSLQQQNEEIRLQKEEIKTMAEKLHESDQMQLKFFSNVSHEFKTPLTLILAPIDEIFSGKEHPESIIRSYLVTIRNNARKLNKMVTQLLEFRKVNEGMVSFAPRQGLLKSFLNNLVADFEPLAAQKGLTLEAWLDLKDKSCYFDPFVIEKVMYNLLSNAVKYTHEGKISIRADYDHASQIVTVVVADTGIGIRSEDQPFVFNRFYREDNAVVSDALGSGIGLAFARELIEIHGGTIGVESEPGKGSTFSFTFKVMPGDHLLMEAAEVPFMTNEHYDYAGSGEVAEQVVFSENLHILIVEDNPEMRHFLANLLSVHFEVTTANNGEEGIQQAEEIVPDLIISDLMMPVMDGLEMSQRLKNNLSTCHIPIVMLTARENEITALKSYRAGVEDYLNKPFNAILLMAKVNSILLNRQRVQQKYSQSEKSEPATFGNSLDDKLISSLKKYICDNILNTNISAEDLCREAGLSKTQLYRKIKALTDLSINIFIRDTRLEIGYDLVVTKKMPVKEAAYASGFTDPNYFSRAFKEKYGKSPKYFSLSDTPV